MNKFSSPFMAKSPFNQNGETDQEKVKEPVNAITGRTASEQNAANEVEKAKQVDNKPEYTAYMTARASKKAWEDESPDNFLKEYPKQKELDSLRTIYKNIN